MAPCRILNWDTRNRLLLALAHSRVPPHGRASASSFYKGHAMRIDTHLLFTLARPEDIATVTAMAPDTLAGSTVRWPHGLQAEYPVFDVLTQRLAARRLRLDAGETTGTWHVWDIVAAENSAPTSWSRGLVTMASTDESENAL